MKQKKRILSAVLSVALCASVFAAVSPISARAETPLGTPYNASGSYDVTVPHVIINQVYGGYNPSNKKDILNDPNDLSKGITYKDKGQACSNSFIELYNPTDSDINLSNWSINYQSSPYNAANQPQIAVNGQWAKLILSKTIKAKSSYLIVCAATGSTSPYFTLDSNKADDVWNMPINNKGFSVVLVDNQSGIAANAMPFDNSTKKPTISGYVDMLSENGNDSTSDEAAPAYEGSVTNSQSKQKAIRRIKFLDTDNNAAMDDAGPTQQSDAQVIGYNTTDSNYLAWARPRYSSDGAWSASTEPNPAETTTLSLTTVNCLTNTFGTDPRSTRAFTWEMPASITSGQVEISQNSDMSNAKTFTAAACVSDNGVANTFRVTVSGLNPGTKYYYTAENGSVKSTVYSFTTEAQKVDQFSFVHISDTQADQLSPQSGALDFTTWGNAIGAVLSQYSPAFLLETGDIVDQANSEDQWRWFFGAAQNSLGNNAFMPVIGNHDETAAYPATAFREHFTTVNSCTDPSVTPGTVYSFDYGAAHFVILDSECKGAGFDAQKKWADLDMAQTKQKYIIVALHRGMYGGSGISDTFTAFGSLLDKYNVSLVLQGHDHAYIRTKAMKNGTISTDGTGTISLETGGSGSKQDSAPSASNYSYMDMTATPNAPCYSIITVSDSAISVHTVTVQNANTSASIQPLQTSAETIDPADSTVDFSINAPTATHGSADGALNAQMDDTTSGSFSINAQPTDVISAATLSKLAQQKKPVTFNVPDGSGKLAYSWTMDGSAMSGTAADLKLGITKNNSPQKSAIDKLAGDSNSLYLSFDYSGALPAPAKITMYVGDKYKDGSTINLYYYNPDTSKAELVAKALTATEGYVTFTITHCSDYFLTANLLNTTGSDSSVSTPSDNGNSASGTGSTSSSNPASSTAQKNPGTGENTNSPDFVTGIFAGLAVIALLAVMKKKPMAEKK